MYFNSQRNKKQNTIQATHTPQQQKQRKQQILENKNTLFLRNYWVVIIASITLLFRRCVPTTTTVAAFVNFSPSSASIHYQQQQEQQRRRYHHFCDPSATSWATSSRRRRRSVRRMQSLSEQEDNNEEDLLKWERMYEAGEKKEKGNTLESKLTDETTTTTTISNTETCSEIKVITFDLDNTLWKTSNVISTANDVLNQHLQETFNLNVPKRVEKVMGDLFAQNKYKYCPKVENEEEIKGPTLLTKLRIDAICSVLMEHNSDKFGEEKEKDAYTFAKQAFDVWTKARHDAIPKHAVSSLLSCLDQIKTLKYANDAEDGYYSPIVIGAITDGNSDPRNVPMLAPYFDFCVNAERIGISKPDRRLYEAAVIEVSKLRLLSNGREEEGEEEEDLFVEDGVGPWWVHVGDDFLKDIVAAKDLRMRTVWSRELVKKKQTKEEEEEEEDTTTTGKTKKSVADLVKELSEKSVINMYIGADDFLADSIERDFADSIVDEFHHVGSVLTRWHEEGQKQLQKQKQQQQQQQPPPKVGEEEILESLNSVTEQMSSLSNEDAAAIAEVLSVVVPDDIAKDVEEKPSVAATAASATTTTTTPESSANSVKFCVYCGTKLPTVAKFCSSCGEKQPELS